VRAKLVGENSLGPTFTDAKRDTDATSRRPTATDDSPSRTPVGPRVRPVRWGVVRYLVGGALAKLGYPG